MHQRVVLKDSGSTSIDAVSGGSDGRKRPFLDIRDDGESKSREDAADDADDDADEGVRDIEMRRIEEFGLQPVTIADPAAAAATASGTGLLRSGLTADTVAAGRSYIVDPLRGRDDGDGSVLRPWKTLAAVLARNAVSSPAPILKAGDTLVLHRGYHGAPTVSGKYEEPGVTVVAAKGHTPIVRSLYFHLASWWTISGLTVTQLGTPLGHADAASKLRGVAISTQAAENCDHITLHRLSIYNAQVAATKSWGAATWKARASGGALWAYGQSISIVQCHLFNAGGLQLGFHTTPARVTDCTIENFASDGAGIRSGGVYFANNVITGARLVDGNHNDMCQAWASKYVIFKNNMLVGQVDPSQSLTVAPGMTNVQGLGAYDGWKEDWDIIGNVIMTDHPVGIWFQGHRRLRIAHNTVVRCGPRLTHGTRAPCIMMGPSKSGGASSGTVVANNVVESLELTSGVGVNANNVVIPAARFKQEFSNWAAKDLRLRHTSSAREKGDATFSLLGMEDLLGMPRLATASKPDCGAFTYVPTSSGAWAAPSPLNPERPLERGGVECVVLDGYGVDVSWEALDTDVCFVVKYGDAVVGTVRTGVSAYMWLFPSSSFAFDSSLVRVQAVSRLSY
jgi:hypothetical protein